MPTRLATTILQPRTAQTAGVQCNAAPSWSRARSRLVAAKNAGSSSTSGCRGRGSSIGSMPTMRPGRLRQDDDAVGQVHRLGHRMGDEHDRRRQRLAQPGEEMAHVLPGDLVEGGERLVHQQQSVRQAPSPGRARRAAASRPTARAGRHRRTRRDRPRRAVRRGARRVARGVAVDFEQQAGVAGHGAPRQQRRGLRHEADALGVARRVGAGAVDLDEARARLVEAPDQAQQGRLAAPGGTEDGDDLTGGDVEIDEPQCFEAAEELGDPAHADRRRHQREGIGDAHRPAERCARSRGRRRPLGRDVRTGRAAQALLRGLRRERLRACRHEPRRGCVATPR